MENNNTSSRIITIDETHLKNNENRRAVYVGFWSNELQELVTFLKEREYESEEVQRLQGLLEGSEIE